MSTKGIEGFIRPELRAFGGYSAAVSPDTLEGKTSVPRARIVKLDANENPYGCSPRVYTALARFKDYHIYTDNDQTRLRAQIASLTGVSLKHIVAGAGSNTLIDLVFRLFLGNNDEVINCVPTFGIYSFSSDLCSAKIIPVARTSEFAVDIPAVKSRISKKTKLICLANPNNPTGNLTSRAEIMELLDLGIPLLLDEAYCEFAGETLADQVGVRENLMVLRTFSKWAGLAGLRVGYGLFPTKVADYLMSIKWPYNVNAAAQIAVEASIEDKDHLMVTVERIIAERDRLFVKLQGIEWLRPYPSKANFILCEVLIGDAKALRQRLQDKGILVRFFDQPALGRFIRISVGTRHDTDALVRALRTAPP